MFRLANMRNHDLTDVHAIVSFARWSDENGAPRRRFDQLALERDFIVFMPLHWVVVHPITDTSPLRGLTQESLAASDQEVVCLITADDETFAQTVHARCSYDKTDIVWGARFRDMYLPDAERVSFSVQFGDLSVLPDIRYIITTDTDTILPRESASRMIGALAHPLNQPEFDPVSGKIIAGYSVLQPRVQVRPAVANLSLFTRSYSGDVSLDLYSRAVSDTYQYLFGEGDFVGKGIYDLSAFERSLRDRVPENSILT